MFLRIISTRVYANKHTNSVIFIKVSLLKLLFTGKKLKILIILHITSRWSDKSPTTFYIDIAITEMFGSNLDTSHAHTR